MLKTYTHTDTHTYIYTYTCYKFPLENVEFSIEII